MINIMYAVSPLTFPVMSQGISPVASTGSDVLFYKGFPLMNNNAVS